MTPRPPVSIVVTGQGARDRLATTLDALRPTLGPRDEVLLVDGADHLGAGVLGRTWVRRVPSGHGDGEQRTAGLRAARHDRVVLLASGAIVTRRWLDELVAPLDDPAVAAVGPATNEPDTSQYVVDAPVGQVRAVDVGRFGRERHRVHRRSVSPAPSLSPRCLAVRRADAVPHAAHDGWPGVLAVPSRTLVVAAGAYVHHDLDLPLVSAALIVKDEEQVLARCLASLDHLADEIVVYDTGSTDGTVELARAAGARVVEGHWDDDFAAARNAGLEHCRGRWILWIDADEELTGDRQALRHLLGRSTADAHTVEIRNLGDDGEVAVAFFSTRVFRRGRARFVGRIHEVPRSVDPLRPLELEPTEVVAVRHHGYTTAVVGARDKATRNLRLAERAATEGDDRVLAAWHLARSQRFAGDLDAALDTLVRTRAEGVGSPALVEVLREGAEVLLQLGRPDEALRWIAEVRALGQPSLADFLAATAHLAAGEHEAALACLDRCDAGVVGGGWLLSQRLIRLRRAAIHLAAGRPGAAGEELLAVVRDEPVQALWTLLVSCRHAAGDPMGPLAEAVPDSEVRRVLAQVLRAEPDAADAFGEALWACRPGDLRLVAFGTQLGPRLGTLRCLEWAARARDADLAEQCPLVRRAGEQDLAGRERVLAAAVAHRLFGDQRAIPLLVRGAQEVADADLAGLTAEVALLAAELVEPFVMAAGTTDRRLELIAATMDQLGDREAAHRARARRRTDAA